MAMSMSILGALKLAPSSPSQAQQPRHASSLHFNLANAALVATSLLLADPALAFRVRAFSPVAPKCPSKRGRCGFWAWGQ
jgi:hypothetical protein